MTDGTNTIDSYAIPERFGNGDSLHMNVRCIYGAGIALLLAATAGAQEDGDLERRVRELEERLEASEARNEELSREVRRSNREIVEREIDDYLERTQELSGAATAGTETKKGAFFKLYGFIRFDLYYNTARTPNTILPSVVSPEDGVAASPNDESFALDVRLTRIGFEFDFGKVGNTDVTGRIETDFANFPSGVPESRETPRIRVAYIQLESAKWRARLGQDWDIFSPLYASVNFETMMWNVGNLGDRRPMAAILYKGAGKLTLEAALGLTGAINNQDLDAAVMPPTFTSTDRDGFDSGAPHVQLRAAYAGDGWVEGKGWVVGVGAAIATLETDTSFGGNTDFTSWAVSFDFFVPITQALLVKGEWWFGQGLGDFRGTIGQFINSATGNEIEGWGGWTELQYAHSDRWAFHMGGTVDDPSNGDVPAGSPELNFTFYGGVRRQWSNRLKSGFDVIFWETQYAGATQLGNMVRFNFYTSVDF